MKKVGINKFVLRQVKGSGKSYSDTLSFIKIAQHAECQIEKNEYKNGYRDGVILINVCKTLIDNFVTPIVKINSNSILKANYTKRRKSEYPYIQIRCLNGTKLKVDSVDLILYRNDVLKETNENSTNCQWELIAFIAKPKNINNLPMGAITMMRNQMQLPGGTKGNYSSDEWAKSIEFWNKYAISDDI